MSDLSEAYELLKACEERVKVLEAALREIADWGFDSHAPTTTEALIARAALRDSPEEPDA
jgi:hypothetical protein